jgi:hypothetical protein
VLNSLGSNAPRVRRPPRVCLATWQRSPAPGAQLRKNAQATRAAACDHYIRPHTQRAGPCLHAPLSSGSTYRAGRGGCPSTPDPQEPAREIHLTGETTTRQRAPRPGSIGANSAACAAARRGAARRARRAAALVLNFELLFGGARRPRLPRALGARLWRGSCGSRRGRPAGPSSWRYRHNLRRKRGCCPPAPRARPRRFRQRPIVPESHRLSHPCRRAPADGLLSGPGNRTQPAAMKLAAVALLALGELHSWRGRFRALAVQYQHPFPSSPAWQIGAGKGQESRHDSWYWIAS